MKARLEADGATVKEGAGLEQAAARADRAGKEYDRAAKRERDGDGRKVRLPGAASL